MPTPWTVGRIYDEIVPAVVRPVLALMLTAAERETVAISIVDWEGNPVDLETAVGENEHMLRVSVFSEESCVWLFEPDLDDGFARRFHNDFQDFISESEFGWGQLRGPVIPL